MARFPNNNPFGGISSSQPLNYQAAGSEVSVAQFFNAVYAWMAAGLGLTAVVAYWVAAQGSYMHILNPGSLIVLFLVQLALVWTISGAINKINATVATVLFLLYAALNGMTLSVLFLLYTKSALASTFFVTAGVFGAMSLYGYVTKRDLTQLGSLLFMALFGIILASIVNIFVASSGLQWIITYAAVLIFVGLTAYDTQKLKMIALQTGGNPALAHRLAIVGSLQLYLDFINLFILLLRIMNDRRN